MPRVPQRPPRQQSRFGEDAARAGARSPTGRASWPWAECSPREPMAPRRHASYAPHRLGMRGREDHVRNAPDPARLRCSASPPIAGCGGGGGGDGGAAVEGGLRGGDAVASDRPRGVGRRAPAGVLRPQRHRRHERRAQPDGRPPDGCVAEPRRDRAARGRRGRAPGDGRPVCPAADRLTEFADTVANASLADLQDTLSEFQNFEEFASPGTGSQGHRGGGIRHRRDERLVSSAQGGAQSPSRSSMASSRRQWGRTLTWRSRKMPLPRSASISGRARVPISRTTRPPLPTTICFCDSVST